MTELDQLLSMLQSTGTKHMVVRDMQDLDQCTVTIENKMVNRDLRVDVVFQFRNNALDRVWVREG